MKDVWKGELNYIEICSGPGRCIDRSGIEFNGSALTIIQHPAFQYIKKALFFDIDNKVIEALNERIKERNSPNAFAFVGNYNQADSICNRLREELNPRSLNLVFIDPSDCSVPFSLIRCIKKILINSDFIINVASGTDFNRNVINALLSPESHNRVISKYNKFLGSDTFFTDEAAIKLAEYKKSQDLRNKFRQSYRNSLENLGYKYFDGKQVMNYYDIIFATVHERGLDFWEKATSYKYNGQGTLKL
jgi:three-Cys-motif partner protein